MPVTHASADPGGAHMPPGVPPVDLTAALTTPARVRVQPTGTSFSLDATCGENAGWRPPADCWRLFTDACTPE